jgi:hypothetical protein
MATFPFVPQAQAGKANARLAALAKQRANLGPHTVTVTVTDDAFNDQAVHFTCTVVDPSTQLTWTLTGVVTLKDVADADADDALGKAIGELTKRHIDLRPRGNQ